MEPAPTTLLCFKYHRDSLREERDVEVSTTGLTGWPSLTTQGFLGVRRKLITQGLTSHRLPRAPAFILPMLELASFHSVLRQRIAREGERETGSIRQGVTHSRLSCWIANMRALQKSGLLSSTQTLPGCVGLHLLSVVLPCAREVSTVQPLEQSAHFIFSLSE